MSVFMPYLLALAALVVFVVLAFARKGPVDRRTAEERRARHAERQRERFFLQQSWRFWRDLFGGR